MDNDESLKQDEAVENTQQPQTTEAVQNDTETVKTAEQSSAPSPKQSEKQIAYADNESNDLSDSLYYEDEDMAYAAFDGGEASEIIFPTEISQDLSVIAGTELKHTQKVKRKKTYFKTALLSFIKNIPTYIELTGEITVNAVSSFFEKYGIVFALPFLLIGSGFKKLFNSIRSAVSKMPKNLSRDIRGMSYEIKVIRKQAKAGSKEEQVSLFKALSKYFVISFSRHSLFWKTVLNTAFPVVMIILAAAALNNFQQQTYALEVIYNGSHIGYIEDEETFEQARVQAIGLLPASVDSQGNGVLSSEPVYKLQRVALNQLSNQDMLCENLIEASDASLVQACGIYIDGEFLCAVRNESDAVSVFNSIIAPSKANATEGTIVAFVEEITYVQGLYSDNESVIWDSLTLRSTLKKPKSEAVYHTVKNGDTVKSITSKYSLTSKQLKALNPSVDFTKLEAGTKLLVAAETDYVRIKVMKTRTRTESVAYETVKKDSSTLAKGTTKTTQKGAYGQKQITELVTYINGEESYSTVVSEKQIKAPVNEIILVGTKTVSPYGSYDGSYSTSSGFIWPARGAYSISSYYGYRSASISGMSFHGGIDIVRSGGGSAGTPVVAAASGTVVIAYSGWTGYGHTVVIDHGNGLRTRYAHMQPGSITVSVGQYVYQGQQIGKIGTTGNSTGPHLHFEVLKNGSKVNPLPYIS